jgi:hypothetical protein
VCSPMAFCELCEPHGSSFNPSHGFRQATHRLARRLRLAAQAEVPPTSVANAMPRCRRGGSRPAGPHLCQCYVAKLHGTLAAGLCAAPTAMSRQGAPCRHDMGFTFISRTEWTAQLHTTDAATQQLTPCLTHPPTRRTC